MPLNLKDASEVLINIFLYLEPQDIHSCQLVCRRFHETILGSPSIKFAIELNLCGYALPLNPRTDISLEEKCEVLKSHRVRRRDCIITSVDSVTMGPANGGFQTQRLPYQLMYPSLKDGVMAEWSAIQPNSTDLQLDVVQLPSPNTGAEFKQWQLVEKDLNIRCYVTEPACNLLVMLGYTGQLVDFEPLSVSWDPRTQIDPVRVERVTDQPLLFHFRTLSTNSPHPKALRDVLDCGLRVSSATDFFVDSLGDLVIARVPHLGNERRGPGLIIYNWVTGALLDRRDEAYQGNLVVLNNETIVMPRSTLRYDSQDLPMGKLDLYYIDWTTPPNPSLTFVAVLELPIVPPILRPPPAYSHDGMPQMSRTPDYTNPHAVVVCRCEFASTSQSGLPAAYMDGPPCTFVPAQSSQLLRVHFDFPYTESIHEPPTRETSLYIPFEVIFDAIKSSCSDSDSVRRIHWDTWGSRARWIHLPPDFWEGVPRAPSGARCLLTRHSLSHHMFAPRPNPDVRNELDVLLLDFNPGFVREVARSKEGFNDRPQPWTYRPPINNQFSPIGPYVDRKHSWLAECGANMAVIPYAWTKLKHGVFDELAQKRDWNIVMDNEHVVVMEIEFRERETRKITAFTF